MTSVFWVIYAMLGVISFYSFCVMDLRMNGRVSFFDILCNIFLACIWFVVWIAFGGIALGCLLLKLKDR